MMDFVRQSWLYIAGFAIAEAVTCYFDGLTGNLTTSLLAIFVIFMFYAWTSK
jgi:hypothetical protein